MPLLIVSFISGLLTVLAPCILPLLPVVLGGTLAGAHSKWRPLWISVSLGVSIIVFTLVLKASSALIDVPQQVWQGISGGILIIFGVLTIFPGIWDVFSAKAHIADSSQRLVAKGLTRQDKWSTILLGASLGPVFASCSPTYFVILATVLPVDFIQGLIYLIVYAAGLVLMLFLIGYAGQHFINKLGWAVNPRGLFKKILGILFIVLGLAIVTGVEKNLESWLLSRGFNITKFEQKLLPDAGEEVVSMSTGLENIFKDKAPELIGVENWVNSEPLTLEALRGKVVLIDFWTYSCINCIRTLPYLQSWHEKYQDDGLVIIGVHAPEFQFERKIANVQAAVDEYGLTYAVVQDNEFATWRAYNNRYWPAKYLIDKDGIIRYTHFGEGAYEETETKIQELLNEITQVSDTVSAVDEDAGTSHSPEVYFGTARNATHIGNPSDTGIFTLPERLDVEKFYLSGSWLLDLEAIQNTTPSSIVYRYRGKGVYIVAGAETPVDIRILRDGNVIDTISISDHRLYTLIEDETAGEHTLTLEILSSGLKAFTFVFG